MLALLALLGSGGHIVGVALLGRKGIAVRRHMSRDIVVVEVAVVVIVHGHRLWQRGSGDLMGVEVGGRDRFGRVGRRERFGFD